MVRDYLSCLRSIDSRRRHSPEALLLCSQSIHFQHGFVERTGELIRGILLQFFYRAEGVCT